jgi:hypothetical protein
VLWKICHAFQPRQNTAAGHRDRLHMHLSPIADAPAPAPYPCSAVCPWRYAPQSAAAGDVGSIKVVHGFKGLLGARALGWPTLRAEIHEVCGPAAKLLLWRSNERQALTDLEEAWLVRALYRDDRLTQP